MRLNHLSLWKGVICTQREWGDTFSMLLGELTRYYDLIMVQSCSVWPCEPNYCLFLGCKPQYSGWVIRWVVPFIYCLLLYIVGWFAPCVWPVELWFPVCSR